MLEGTSLDGSRILILQSDKRSQVNIFTGLPPLDITVQLNDFLPQHNYEVFYKRYNMHGWKPIDT